VGTSKRRGQRNPFYLRTCSIGNIPPNAATLRERVAAKHCSRLMQQLVQKIGAAVVPMMAVGRAMTGEDEQADLLEFLRNPFFS
jgi:hypothetical protein